MLQIRFLEALPSSKTPGGGYSAKNPSRLATRRLQRYVEECPRSLIASARTRKPLGSLWRSCAPTVVMNATRSISVVATPCRKPWKPATWIPNDDSNRHSSFSRNLFAENGRRCRFANKRPRPVWRKCFEAKRPLVGSKNGRHWQRGDVRFALRSTQLSCVDRRPNVNQLAPIIQVLDPIISARTSPIRIPVELNTKQIVPRGSSADETIRAISSAEKYRGCTFTFRGKDKSESATSGTL